MTPADMAALHAKTFTVPRPWSETEFASLLQSPHVFAIGDALGFILGRAIAGEAEVLTLAVDPAQRRAGIARNLMRAFCRQSVARGAMAAFLEVAEGNLAAIALYQTTGFAIVGRRVGYFKTGKEQAIDALVLSMPLDQRETAG
ncbi:MAG: ribosomal-protein-alanine N-acetyltransferase [Pseudorhodobacter sp.]|jgi:ribosomal-protein-alanine N-acetyltransferase